MSVQDIASQSSVIFEHDWKDPFSRFMIPKVIQDISYERWDNKLPSNSLFFQQYLCQKLPKSVDMHWCYSVQRQCRFLDTV